MRYFVTGATGFIGGRVAWQLIDSGHQVNALVRDPAKAAELAQLGATLYRGDITDKESMRAPMQGVDGVFHMAAWYQIGVRDTRDSEPVNIQGTRNVLELMKELGVPKGVYTSTTAVNADTHGELVDETYRYTGPHFNQYNRTKWAAHYQVAEPMIAEGLPLVIVMPSAVYGPGETGIVHGFLAKYLQRKLPMIPTGLSNSWVYIDDVAQGHILAMEKGQVGQTYIIGGDAHTVLELLQMAEKSTGVPPSRRMASPGMLRGMASVTGVVEKVIPLPIDYSAEFLRSSAGVTNIGSNAKAKRDLGYNPRPLEDGIVETMQYEMQLLGMEPAPGKS